jgi:hypothetical protein
VTEAAAVNKPAKSARPLADLASSLLAESYRKQGFASSELIVRWETIAGTDVASHAEPLKIQWPRRSEGENPEPGTLVLRVDGPAAIEIQHMSQIILERVNRYFGFAAIDRIAIRQAPLRSQRRRPARTLDPQAIQQVADTLPDTDEALKMALARLGAAVKRK